MKQVPRYNIDQVSIRLKRERSRVWYSHGFDEPKQVAEALYRYYAKLDREVCLVVNVDAKAVPINYNIVSMGSLTGSDVTLRELFKSSILSNAYGIILVHNHPSSGDPSPSRQDIEVTHRVRRGCVLLGIRLLDHIIVGGSPENYYSFSEEGYILKDDE